MRAVEILVMVNALCGIAAFGLRYWKRRQLSNPEHVRRLEAENKEIDDQLERWRSGKS